jgi:predicted flap endonuclease-1-like 5' DNA nuclease
LSGLSQAEKVEFGSVLDRLVGRGATGDNLTTDEKFSGEISGALFAAEEGFGMTLHDVRAIADQLPTGGAAAILLLEHRWATGFSDAVREAGGEMVAEGFLTEKTLFMLGSELEAQTHALAVIQEAQAMEEEATLEALEIVVISEAIKAAAAYRAVEALRTEALVEEAAIERATEVVAAAMVAEQAALERVENAIAAAEAYEAQALAAAASTAGQAPAEPLEQPKFERPVTSIEGIGPAYGQKLRNAGIRSLADLLKQGSTRSGRAALANQSEISAKLILVWVHQADLRRIWGVGSEYADLLAAAGVGTVLALAQRNPSNLHQTLVEVNEEKRLVREVPGQKQVENWIGQAKDLPRVVSF